jgi:hypothetical protein
VPRYVVTVVIGSRFIVFQSMYFSPGTYSLELKAPLERMYANVRVLLSLPNGEHYEDWIALSFNMHFLETVKFVLVIPFALTVLALSYVRKEHTVIVPRMQARARRYRYEEDW